MPKKVQPGVTAELKLKKTGASKKLESAENGLQKAYKAYEKAKEREKMMKKKMENQITRVNNIKEGKKSSSKKSEASVKPSRKTKRPVSDISSSSDSEVSEGNDSRYDVYEDIPPAKVTKFMYTKPVSSKPGVSGEKKQQESRPKASGSSESKNRPSTSAQSQGGKTSVGVSGGNVPKPVEPERESDEVS